MIKLAEFTSEVFKSSRKSQLIYRQGLLFPAILSTIETIFKVQFLNKINIFLAKRNLNCPCQSTTYRNTSISKQIEHTHNI